MYKEMWCLKASVDFSTLSYFFERAENDEYLATTLWVDENGVPVGGNDGLKFFTEEYVKNNLEKFFGDLYVEDGKINMTLRLGNTLLRNE